jgi:hypothetical protein
MGLLDGALMAAMATYDRRTHFPLILRIPPELADAAVERIPPRIGLTFWRLVQHTDTVALDALNAASWGGSGAAVGRASVGRASLEHGGGPGALGSIWEAGEASELDLGGRSDSVAAGAAGGAAGGVGRQWGGGDGGRPSVLLPGEGEDDGQQLTVTEAAQTPMRSAAEQQRLCADDAQSSLPSTPVGAGTQSGMARLGLGAEQGGDQRGGQGGGAGAARVRTCGLPSCCLGESPQTGVRLLVCACHGPDAAYCCREHQKEAWKVHRLSCPYAQARKKPAGSTKAVISY